MLKILVPVKKVVDYNVQVRPTFDNKSVDIANVKMGINPFDEIALEEAVRTVRGHAMLLSEVDYARQHKVGICNVTLSH